MNFHFKEKMRKEVITIFCNQFIKYCKMFAIAVFPTKAIATFFGIGYLPEWQDHWSTFFSIIFIAIFLHFFVGIENDILNIAEELMFFALVLFILSFISIHLFKKQNKSAKYEITIHLVFGQILTIALSIPGIATFQQKVIAFDTSLCQNFIYCSSWFLNVIIYLPTILFPYFVFQLINALKPWPSYLLDKNYNNAIGNTFLGFFNAIYATIFIYLLSFLFFDLNLVSVIKFYGSLFMLIGLDLRFNI